MTNRKPTIDEIAQVMAKIAMGTDAMTLTAFQRHAAQLFVEDLVLPKSVNEYSETQMREYVLNYINMN